MSENKNDYKSDLLVSVLKEHFHGLIICLSRSWGGLEQVAAADSLELGQLGLKTRVLLLEGTPIHEHLSKKKDIDIFPLNFKPRDFLDFRLKKELERQIADGVNVIHTHQTTLLGSIIPWIWGKRNIGLFATRHIMSNHNKRNIYHRLLYKRIDKLLVLSDSIKKNVLDTHPFKPSRIQVVKPGLDFERFDPARIDSKKLRSQWGADDNTIVVGVVGRLDPAKGQGTFIRAIAGLQKTLKPDTKVKFVIVGEETLGSTINHLKELKDMVKQFHIEDQMVFTGYLENIPEVMGAFDVFVMPSRREAFGLVAIEAMAMSCPIIISSGGSADDIIGDNEFGLKTRPGDAFDLQKQIGYLITHPDERKKMGDRAREFVKKNYDRRERLQNMLRLYEETITRRSKL
jgi:L-malate glycosyltransferase